MEKMNVKLTSGIRAVKEGGGHCGSLYIQYVAVSKVASVAFIVLLLTYFNLCTIYRFKYTL